MVKATARPWAAVAWRCGFPLPILQCFWAAVCLTVSPSETWGRGRICFVSRSVFARIRNYPLSSFLGKILSESSQVIFPGGHIRWAFCPRLHVDRGWWSTSVTLGGWGRLWCPGSGPSQEFLGWYEGFPLFRNLRSLLESLSWGQGWGVCIKLLPRPEEEKAFGVQATCPVDKAGLLGPWGPPGLPRCGAGAKSDGPRPVLKLGHPGWMVFPDSGQLALGTCFKC